MEGRRLHFSIKTRRIKIGAVVVVVALGIAGATIATHWPFTRESVIEALEQTFAATVEVNSFRVTYFAPGCVLEGVTLRRNLDHEQGQKTPPIASVERLTIQGSYTGFFMFPKRVPRVKVEGLRVFASPESERAGHQPLPAHADQVQVVIGEINADEAILEFSSGEAGARPLKLEIHKLTLNGVGHDRAMAFHAALRNPTPPGEIRTDGQFGPLRRDDPGKTRASGSYVFVHADLGAFAGMAGTLSSTGKFGGVLEQLEVAGNTDVPNFEVDRSRGHQVHLKTDFAATVNGMNGDVVLKSVGAEFGKTSLAVRGKVTGNGAAGKTVTLVGTQKQGTIEDWLQLLAQAEHPAMTGAMNFRVQVEIPPGERDFLDRTNLQGDFAIGSADFTKPTTQNAVDTLSHVALGGKPNQAPPAGVEESMKGHVEMKKVVATFTDFYFGVPGALAHMHGTYGILTEKIDLHGTLRVDHKLSNGATGIKAVLLKAAEPFFAKKKQAEIVPIKVGGTYPSPSYGLDVMP
jgi:AsmA-like C-terminal region